MKWLTCINVVDGSRVSVNSNSKVLISHRFSFGLHDCKVFSKCVGTPRLSLCIKEAMTER